MKTPVIHPNAYIAPNATVVGDVHIGAGSSVFFGSVLRGDREPIAIGEDTNIQDNCVLHQEYGCPTTVGSRVTVGHGAILHGCTIGDETLIGMGAILLNGAVVGRHCIVGAGALVTQNTIIPDGSLVYGSPAKVKGQLDEAAIADILRNAVDYRREAADWFPRHGDE